MCLFKNVKFVENDTMIKIHRSQPTQADLESSEESFRNHYFLYIVDQTIGSLDRRFEQYSTYENNFGFLFSIDRLRSLFDTDLKACCKHLGTCLNMTSLLILMVKFCLKN